MRNVVIGSFVGFLLAAAVLAACGGAGGGPTQAQLNDLQQQIVQLQADLAAHTADADAHHTPSRETEWLGMTWCIALEGVYPSRSKMAPVDPVDELAYEPQVGSVALFAGNFAPRGWARCEGQLLLVNDYAALFSLVGSTYGGDGFTTFGLPDLRGRTPVGVGTRPGRGSITLGQQGP
jgi:microcystin-dependent protein